LIIDLKNLEKINKISVKFCIIGGGTTGLFLAHRLRLSKIPVTVIEAGGETSSKSINFNYDFKDSYYSRTLLKDRFALGGTTRVWGGQMIPFLKSDIKERDYLGLKAWNIKYEEIAKYFPVVNKCFKFKFLENKSNVIKKKKCYNFSKKYFNLRFSTFIKPKIKNFYDFFYDIIKKDNKLNIYINAKVLEINNSKDNSSIKNIIAKSSNGNTLEIETDILIICCGALESTRLLFIYDKKNNNFIKKQKSPLGHFLSEQLSFISGKFIIKDWKKFILHFSPIYQNGLIHSPRLELNNKFQKKNLLQNAFCQLIFIHKKTHWLNLLKLSLKKRGLNYRNILIIILSISEILKDFYNLFIFRIINKSIWYNKPYKILLSITLEQLPNFNNRLFLKKDIFGSNKLIINHKVRNKDIYNIKLISKTFKILWIESELNKIAELKIRKTSDFNKKNFIETYHSTGTIRIGSKKTNSVVDKNLKLWNINNLYICSTALFPSSGCANTGFTLLAMTARLGEYLKKLHND